MTSTLDSETAAPTDVVDFRRPAPLGLEQTRAVRTVHEALCELLSPMLTTRLRTPLRLSVRNLEMVSGDELTQSCAKPSLIVILELAPLATPMALRVPMDLAVLMLDMLLGGPGTVDDSPTAPSPVEEQILRRLIEHCIPAIDHAWAQLLAIRARVMAVTADVEVLDLLPLMEPFLKLDLAVDVDSRPHSLDIWLPGSLLTSAIQSSEPAPAPVAAHPVEFTRSALSDVLTAVPVRATVSFPAVQMTPARILSLVPGDVVTIASVDQLLSLAIGDIPIALVRPARDGRRTACQVVSTCHGTPPVTFSSHPRRGVS